MRGLARWWQIATQNPAQRHRADVQKSEAGIPASVRHLGDLVPIRLIAAAIQSVGPETAAGKVLPAAHVSALREIQPPGSAERNKWRHNTSLECRFARHIAAHDLSTIGA